MRTRVCSALHRLLWRLQRPDRTQNPRLVIPILGDCFNVDIQPPMRRANMIPQIPLLRAVTALSRLRTIHRLVSQLTVVAKISALMPPAMRTRNTSRTRKRLKRTLKRKATVIVRRQTHLCCGLQRSGLCLPLEISLRCNVVSNVAAFRHRFLQTRKLKRGMTRTSAAIHLLDPTTLQTLKPLLPTRPALREIQVMIIRWNLQADELGRLSSTSSRVGKERSSKKGMRSKGAEGPASNISFNGNSPG